MAAVGEEEDAGLPLPLAAPILGGLGAAEEEDELEALIPQQPPPAAGLLMDEEQEGMGEGEEEGEPPPEALDAEALAARCEARLRRIEAALGDYDAASGPRLAAYRRGVEEAHATKEPKIIPHARQSYFGPYFVDEKGQHPPLAGQSKVVATHLRKLQEAREEHSGWTASEEKKLKLLVLEEKVKARVRLGLGPAGKDGAAPLFGRMGSRAQYEENVKVEAEVDWRKIADALKPFQPKRLRTRGRPRSVKEIVAHWRNKLGAPEKFTREEAQRVMTLAGQFERHEWEAVARELATGHSAIQCLREYQRHTTQQQQGGGLFKKGPWTQEEDARLAEGVGMYADNWTLISQHVGSRTAAQCRFRRASQLLNKAPFSREEQMRVALASLSYCPESWATPGDKAEAKRLRRHFDWGGAEEGEEMEEEDMESVGRPEPHEEGGKRAREYGTAWSSVAEHLPTRTDAQCRARWLNTLHPRKAKGEWGEEELDRLWDLTRELGAGDWVRIARELGTGRTRMQVKQCHKRLSRLDALAKEREAAAASAAAKAEAGEGGEEASKTAGEGNGGGSEAAGAASAAASSAAAAAAAAGDGGGAAGTGGGGTKEKKQQQGKKKKKKRKRAQSEGDGDEEGGEGDDDDDDDDDDGDGGGSVLTAAELDDRVKIARRPNGRPYAVVGDAVFASLAGASLGAFAIAGSSTTRLPRKKKRKAPKEKMGRLKKRRRKGGEGGEGDEEEEEVKPPKVPKKRGRPRKTVEEKRATRRAIKKRARERARQRRLEELRAQGLLLQDVAPQPELGEVGPSEVAPTVVVKKSKGKGNKKAEGFKYKEGGVAAADGAGGGGGGGKKRARPPKAEEGEGDPDAFAATLPFAPAAAAAPAVSASSAPASASASAAAEQPQQQGRKEAEAQEPAAKRAKSAAKPATTAVAGAGKGKAEAPAPKAKAPPASKGSAAAAAASEEASVATSGGASGAGAKKKAATIALSDDDEEEKKKCKESRAEARAARAVARATRFDDQAKEE